MVYEIWNMWPNFFIRFRKALNVLKITFWDISHVMDEKCISDY